MKASNKNENNIFLFAFLGSLLAIAAIGFMIADFANMATSQVNFTGATLNGSFALLFLYRAVKGDKARLSRTQF
ncbi:MAG: hypothetical protein V4649_13290 [Bacteroidota bacterium]